MNGMSRRGVLWAIIGAVVLVAAVIGSIVLVANRESSPEPTSSSTYDPGPSNPGERAWRNIPATFLAACGSSSCLGAGSLNFLGKICQK